MKRAALIVVVVLFLLGLPTMARAALLPHYDLTSLAFQAKNVVRAKQTAERKIDEYTTLRTMVVIANYKGELPPGATFEVSTDSYSLEAYEDLFDPPAKPAVVGPEMILFLAPRGEIVSSGLRIFRDGKAQRFGQMSNPGGYYPIPQGLDPWDLCDDPRAKVSVDLPGLEAQIAVALRRAKEVKVALHASDPRALAALVGDITEAGEEPACYDDAVAGAILGELAKQTDIAAFLDAASRTKETRYRFPPQADVHERALLAAAENRGLPLTSRLAALRLLRERAHFIFQDAAVDSRFLALTEDPEPRMRAAALLVRNHHRSLPGLEAAIRSRWAVETDDRVRVALVRAAASENMRADLMTPGAKWPIIAVYAANGQILVPWAAANPIAGLELVSANLTMRRDGRTRSANLSRTIQSLSGGGEGLLGVPIVFDPPLAPGNYDAEIAIVLEERAPPGTKSLKKTVSLGKLSAPPPIATPPPVTSSTFPIDDVPTAPEPTTTTPSGSASPPPRVDVPVRPIPPRRSGCACDLAHPRGQTLESLAFVAVLAILVARRSQRTRAS